jgi:hypothetical protein
MGSMEQDMPNADKLLDETTPNASLQRSTDMARKADKGSPLRGRVSGPASRWPWAEALGKGLRADPTTAA